MSVTITSSKQNEIKSLDRDGVNFIANEEGMILHPYLDQVGVPTIGVGCTYYEDGRRVSMKDPFITKTRALALFANLLKNYELEVYSRTRDDINQHQFNALTSLCFNIGRAAYASSTVLKRVNYDIHDPAIKPAFEMWQNAGKRKGILLERRKREWKLYFS